MGRARGGKQQIAVAEFNTILGKHRGSAMNAGERAVAEHETRSVALKEYVQSLLVAEAGLVSVGALAHFYEGEITRERLDEILDEQVASTNMKELTEILKRGDPPYCPGLTAPAVEAVGRFYSSYLWLDWKKLTKERGHGEVEAYMRRQRTQAEEIVKKCFSGGYAPAHYQRLQPLCQGLAVLIESEEGLGAGQSMRLRVAIALRAAPTEVLEGPLSGWVQAFARRIRDGRINDQERKVLQKIISDQALASGQVAAAFKPIADIL